GNNDAADLVSRIRNLIGQIDQIIRSTDFKALYDSRQGLFTIGYNPETQRPDFSKYDLLASEARQASFIAIAKGDVPQKHWFKLGRPLTIINHLQALVSWSGSMFEYLLPELIIKSVPNSMIYQSCVAMVEGQIRYGKKKNVPWGISEAQYYRFDTDANYQYRAFGVSELSFQSIMQSNLVIAPYATMLALSIMPKETIENMKLLISLGAEDEYGFFESIDFTVPDTSQHKRYSIIRSYMAHHQGMSLVSIDNAVNKNIMQKRFHQEPMIQATEVLLEEYNPANLFTLNNKEYNLKINPVAYAQNFYESRTYHNPSLTYPSAHVLCNDHYMMMLTTGGGGFSKCDRYMINRWRSDVACNLYGTFFYVRDLATKKVHSTTYYPLIAEPDEYEAVFSIDKAEYTRKDGVVKTHTEITLSPIDNIEVRRITFHNGGSEEKELEVTSYLELVNDTYESDLAHPAFSKLFNEIEYVQGSSMLVCKRRAREQDEKSRYIVHFVLYGGKYYRAVEFETDKKRFVGRGNTLVNPDAMNSTLSLSNLGGQTTDPIASLRVAVKVGAGKSATVSYMTGFCQTWEEVVELHHKYGISYNLNDIFELARVDSELELFYLNITSHQFNIIQDVIGTIYYPSNLFRTSEDVIKRNKSNQTGLWRFGISGDHPVILLRISDLEDIRAAKDVITAYEFFKKNLIDVDLVLLNEQVASYTNDLTGMLLDLTSNLRMYEEDPQKRSLFILQSYLMTPVEIDLLLTASRLVINAKTGFSYWFAKELLLDKSKRVKNVPPYFLKQRQSIPATIPEPEDTGSVRMATAKTLRTGSFHEGALEFNNNLGGFANYGEEYEIRLHGGQKTPMPWINVIANEHFGFHISESGSGYTWAVNSRENKLTTWSNDPISDPPSEIVYFRDEDTGEYTTPTCGPINDNGDYTIRHGHGYSVFEHSSMELKQRMTVFAAADDPVKIIHIRIKNESATSRRISAILYLEWVLGISREKTTPYIVTEMDEPGNLMTAHNVYSINFSHHYAFVSVSEKVSSYTGSRTEFIGVNGSLAKPEAFGSKEFSNNTGAGYDPCSVLKINMDMEPDETKEVVFVLGQTAIQDNVSRLVQKHCSPANAKYELGVVKAGWKLLLGTIKIKTPDRALNILVNEWLLYQVVSCRLRSRAAFYQCGGAYGFRDQLQDVLALLHTDPARAKEQILLCCSRQFPEGDI
ncbi:MAG: GH36-type glycosyl hydrolase domain-containing protein, partial [Saccharofermentanales bacterium]